MSRQNVSPRIAELIRGCLNRLLDDPEDFFEAIDGASIPEEVTDPVLLGNYRRVNRATVLQWVEANLRDPGCEVPPYTGSEIASLTRDLVRHGLDMNALETYRSGQNITWQKWMEVAFAETDDPKELHELLAITARSIFAYVEETMVLTADRIRQDREEFSQTGAERLETVVLVLEESPIDPGLASARLHYSFEGTHLAAVVWNEREADPEQLETAADRLARAAASESQLNVHASSAALWTWIKPAREISGIAAALQGEGEVRFALGSPLPGIEGFRQSHADAVEIQRLVLNLGSGLNVARFDEMKVAALLTGDEERTRRFVNETLGALTEAPENLRETLRAYFRHQSKATRTAEALFAHRNTILARIAKAEELLPAPLDGSSLEVSLALEILHWQQS